MDSTATDGCPINPKKKSCLNWEGESDPIHNYMDYSIDVCYEGFMAKQVERMRNMWVLLRKGN
jgi:hypothetical protein